MISLIRAIQSWLIGFRVMLGLILVLPCTNGICRSPTVGIPSAKVRAVGVRKEKHHETLKTILEAQENSKTHSSTSEKRGFSIN